MTRWLPRTLFARLVLVLLTGLVLAQLLSFAVYWQERGRLVLQTSGMRYAQRIADIVRLLDPLSPADRARIVGVMDAPPLRVSLTQPPLAPDAGDPDDRQRATRFAFALRRFLQDDYPLVVNVTGTPPAWLPPPGPDGIPPPANGPGPMMGPGMMAGRGPGFGPHAHVPGNLMSGLSFVVQARLRDGTLVTFDSRQPEETVNWPVRLMGSLAVLLVAVILLTLFAARWITRPLKTLADAAERLGADIEQPPIAESGPLEVSRAARAFNTMQRRLASFIHDRTRLFAAMSHDLKTPITRLRLRAELLEDPALRARFEKDLDEMQAMVSATLDFMRGVANREPPQPIDVMALIESVQDDVRELNGSVAVEGRAARPYAGHPQALKRCLRNVVENAVRYGKAATIRVKDTALALTVSVLDEGPGIPESELERVFEPFHRLEGSRSRDTGGTGLGLSIARNIARAHGGDLVLRNRPQGGLEAEITLPRKA